MSKIVDGNPVSAGYTNPKFLGRDVDDTASGVIGLNNADTASGSSVTNIQREHNSVASFVGKELNAVWNLLPTFTNSQGFTATQSLFARLEAVSLKFSNSAGHAHTGNPGDGPAIAANTLTGAPLRGYGIQGTQLSSVSGGSTDVSSALTGKSPSASPTTAGVVVNTPYNKVVLRNANGDEFIDLLGNQVYGRVTESSGVWTLTFYVLLGSTETAYSFVTPVTIDWYYQELYNTLSNPPTYDPSFYYPSDNATADVLDASETVAGKVLLANAAPAAIAATGAKGSGTRAAKIDHTHEGLHSISKSGSAQIKGDATLTGGTNVTLTQVGNDISISSAGYAPPVTTKGDIFGYDTAPTRVPVGTNGQILYADSAQTTGLRWDAPPSTSSPLTTKGDIYGFDTANTRVPVGSNGLPLVADSTAAPGVTYKVLPIAGGGTNNGSLGVTAGTMYYGDGSKLVALAPGTAGQVLVSGGAGAPFWTSRQAMRATQPNAQTISANSYTTVNYSSVAFNYGNGVITTGAGWKYTPAVEGVYLVCLSVSIMTPNIAANWVAFAGVFKNGLEIARGNRVSVASGSYIQNSYFGVTALALVDMNGTTDYITGGIYQDSNGTLARDTEAGGSTISIHRIF